MRIFVTLIFITLFSQVVLSQSTELRYNLEKGKTYKVKSTSTQNQKVTVQGNEQNTETTNISYVSIKMLDAKPDYFLAEVKFDTTKTIVSMPYTELSSAEEGDMKSLNVIEVIDCVLHRLSKSSLVAKMSYTGHVQDILNHQIIEQTLLEGSDSLHSMAVSALNQIQTLASKESLIGMIEGVTAFLPNEKIKKGGKWESSYESKNSSFGMNITSNYTLKELTKDKATIEGSVIVEPTSTEPIKMNGAEITNELRGLGKTNMEIDPETGWIISGTSKMQLSGNMIVKSSGQDMTLPIESLITTETKAIE